jgi:hypothetical protein
VGDFVQQLGVEVDQLAAAGRIKADYLKSPQAETLLEDTIRAIDAEPRDAEQLALLRKLFRSAAIEKLTDRNSILPREYLNIGKELSAGEIQLLAASYSFVQAWRGLDDEQKKDQARSKRWRGLMKERTGLQHVALIERYERRLHEKGLLADDKSIPTASTGRIKHDRYRLTDLGLAFCEYLRSKDDSQATTPAADQDQP